MISPPPLLRPLNLNNSINSREKSLLYFFEKLLTFISVSDIIVISTADITEVVTMKRRVNSMSNTALTEAVYYILLSLIQPMHGYGIMQNVEQLSKGRVKLAAGTLYGAINTLLEKGWIISLPGEKDSRKKEYQITEQGKQTLKTEIIRLRELIENGSHILEVK
jgi:DNA-binding PadR family transcriptional regulator